MLPFPSPAEVDALGPAEVVVGVVGRMGVVASQEAPS